MSNEKVIKTMTVYPVSYFTDSGTQINSLWSHNPGDDVVSWVGEAIEVEVFFPELGNKQKEKQIAALEAKLNALREAVVEVPELTI